jgi:hypothetical protein
LVHLNAQVTPVGFHYLGLSCALSLAFYAEGTL